MTIRKLNLSSIFADESAELTKARERAASVHGSGDIRAAGNEVEEAVREFLKRMLPPRYYVTTGHLIDQGGNVSPQLDVIIADNFNLPSLMTTKDGTEYIPTTSALAVGEVKSTYRHADRPYARFSDVLRGIHDEMYRPLIENTAYPTLGPHTTMEHLMIGSSNKFLNHLFAFFLCVGVGDFDFDKIRNTLTRTNTKYLPNATVLLDGGIIAYSYLDGTDQRFAFHKYPSEVSDGNYDWCFAKGHEPQQGSHLAFLYGQLIAHLVNSCLPPANAYPYIQEVGGVSRSSIRWARGESGET